MEMYSFKWVQMTVMHVMYSGFIAFSWFYFFWFVSFYIYCRLFLLLPLQFIYVLEIKLFGFLNSIIMWIIQLFSIMEKRTLA